MVDLPSELRALLSELSLEQTLPSFAGVNVLTKPTDLYRSYLATIVHSLVEDIDPDAAYGSIQLSSTLDNGDLAIVVPRLRQAEIPAEALAADLIRRV